MRNWTRLNADWKNGFSVRVRLSTVNKLERCGCSDFSAYVLKSSEEIAVYEKTEIKAEFAEKIG